MNMFSQQQTPDDIDMVYSTLEKMDLSDAIDTRGALLDTSSSKNRKRHRDPNSDPNTRKQMKPSGPENKNSNPNPVYFRPIRKSEAEDTIDDIKEALDVPIEIANIIYTYTPPPPPKIQFWNDYPGRATLRSWDHKIYMLGANGPVGPLGITDEKGSYSLSRRPNEDVNDKIDHFAGASKEVSKEWLMGIRETILLNVLEDGGVTSWEVAKHEESSVDHFDHIIYHHMGPLDPGDRDRLDYTRAPHRILPDGDIGEFYPKDRKGEDVTDAETVVAANWYTLTLTRSGDLYFNQDLYMENVQSIAKASTGKFVLILKKPHEHEFHCNDGLISYLKNQDSEKKDDMEEFRHLHGENFGLRGSSLPVVGPAVYIENHMGNIMGNIMGYIALRTDGRLETNGPIPPEIKTRLSSDKSNYVKRVAASYSMHYAALLELGDGSQEVYVWRAGYGSRVDFKMNPCFEMEDPETGRAVRKRIVDITISDNSLSDVYNYFMLHSTMSSKRHHKNVIALNFEDNSSCLLLISKDGEELSFLASFPSEHTRSIHNTADGMLVVTDSKILKITEPGRRFDIVTDSKRRRYVSFVASHDGYVIVYPGGEYDISKSVQPPIKIKNTIRQGGGIAEIHHDKSGTFHAILRNGTLVSWYSVTSLFFRNTPEWDMDKSLEVYV